MTSARKLAQGLPLVAATTLLGIVAARAATAKQQAHGSSPGQPSGPAVRNVTAQHTAPRAGCHDWWDPCHGSSDWWRA